MELQRDGAENLGCAKAVREVRKTQGHTQEPENSKARGNRGKGEVQKTKGRSDRSRKERVTVGEEVMEVVMPTLVGDGGDCRALILTFSSHWLGLSYWTNDEWSFAAAAVYLTNPLCWME